MKLIDLIITIFETRWNDRIFVNIYNDYRKFSDFIKEVFQFYYLITEAQTTFGTKLKVALWATNSTSYIAAYIALILKNVDFYLIPPKMNSKMVVSIIANSDINILFGCVNVSQYEVASKVSNYPYFKFGYDIQSKTFLYTSKQGKDFISELRMIAEEEYKVTDIRELVLVDMKLNNNRRDREIAVFSSGAESLYPRALYFNDEKVYNGLLKLVHSDLLPSIENTTVYAEVDFATAHIWTLLWPLYSNCKFAFSNTEAEIAITNNGLFEQHWQYVSKNLYETKLLGKLLLKSCFNWLLLIILRFKLKKYFHFGTRKKGIIILNAFLAPRITQTIVGHLPVYTTYGIQEANQIVTVNNYSTKRLKKDACVGEPFTGIFVSIRETNIQGGEGSLMLMSDHFSNLVEMEKEVYYDTRDHATIENEGNKALVNVYGKIRYAIKDSHHNGANYENIERILKNIPYFKEVLFFFDDSGDLHVIIFPNIGIVEANDFGLIDFHNFVKGYKSLLVDNYGIDFVKDIKLVYQDFAKTHDFKIKKIYYKNFDVVCDW